MLRTNSKIDYKNEKEYAMGGDPLWTPEIFKNDFMWLDFYIAVLAIAFDQIPGSNELNTNTTNTTNTNTSISTTTSQKLRTKNTVSSIDDTITSNTTSKFIDTMTQNLQRSTLEDLVSNDILLSMSGGALCINNPVALFLPNTLRVANWANTRRNQTCYITPPFTYDETRCLYYLSKFEYNIENTLRGLFPGKIFGQEVTPSSSSTSSTTTTTAPSVTSKVVINTSTILNEDNKSINDTTIVGGNNGSSSESGTDDSESLSSADDVDDTATVIINKEDTSDDTCF